MTGEERELIELVRDLLRDIRLHPHNLPWEDILEAQLALDRLLERYK